MNGEATGVLVGSCSRNKTAAVVMAVTRGRRRNIAAGVAQERNGSSRPSPEFVV